MSGPRFRTLFLHLNDSIVRNVGRKQEVALDRSSEIGHLRVTSDSMADRLFCVFELL